MNEREPGGHDTVECGWFEKKNRFEIKRLVQGPPTVVIVIFF